jgi:GTP-binding nuclear protein Ran
MKRHMTAGESEQYDKKRCVVIYPLVFNTNRGPIKFNCWVAADGCLRPEENYDEAQCAILMYDDTSPITSKNIHCWRRDLELKCGKNIPIVICANKRSTKPRKKNKKYLNVEYMAINAESDTKFYLELVFLKLAWKLMNDKSLMFVKNEPGPSFERSRHRVTMA